MCDYFQRFISALTFILALQYQAANAESTSYQLRLISTHEPAGTREEFLPRAELRQSKIGGTIRWHLVNRVHNLRAQVDSAGIALSPRTPPEDGAWTWEYRYLGIRRGNSAWRSDNTHRAPADIRENIIYRYHTHNVAEWYQNSEAGILQGFTISTKPDSNTPGKLIIAGSIQSTLQANHENEAELLFTQNSRAVLIDDQFRAFDNAGKELAIQVTQNATHPSTIEYEIEDRGALYPITVKSVLNSPQLMSDW